MRQRSAPLWRNAKSKTGRSKHLTQTQNIIRKKIGNTVYRIVVYHSGTSTEGIEDKILRLAQQDAAKISNVSNNANVASHALESTDISAREAVNQ